MPPARVRVLDDSRSDASSTVFSLKDRNNLGTMNGIAISKAKKHAHPVIIGNGKFPVTSTGPTSAPADADLNLPSIDWTSMSVSQLHAYRIANRLTTQPSYTHPHAEIIYRSSTTALRSPSAVLARRKLHELKHQRRKAAAAGIGTLTTSRGRGKERDKEKDKDKDKDTDTSSNSDRLLKPKNVIHETAEAETTSLDASSSTTDHHQSTYPPINPDTLGRQSPTSLATAVRKHFNAQQLNEAEVVARFTYVAKQSRSSRSSVRTEGSTGDCRGWWMGSQGREVRRAAGSGGEVGFRVRFRP